MSVRMACTVEAWPTIDGAVAYAAWPAGSSDEDIAKIKSFSWPITPETARGFAAALVRAAANAERIGSSDDTFAA